MITNGAKRRICEAVFACTTAKYVIPLARATRRHRRACAARFREDDQPFVLICRKPVVRCREVTRFPPALNVNYVLRSWRDGRAPSGSSGSGSWSWLAPGSVRESGSNQGSWRAAQSSRRSRGSDGKKRDPFCDSFPLSSLGPKKEDAMQRNLIRQTLALPTMLLIAGLI